MLLPRALGQPLLSNVTLIFNLPLSYTHGIWGFVHVMIEKTFLKEYFPLASTILAI